MEKDVQDPNLWTRRYNFALSKAFINMNTFKRFNLQDPDVVEFMKLEKEKTISLLPSFLGLFAFSLLSHRLFLHTWIGKGLNPKTFLYYTCTYMLITTYSASVKYDENLMGKALEISLRHEEYLLESNPDLRQLKANYSIADISKEFSEVV